LLFHRLAGRDRHWLITRERHSGSINQTAEILLEVECIFMLVGERECECVFMVVWCSSGESAIEWKKRVALTMIADMRRRAATAGLRRETSSDRANLLLLEHRAALRADHWPLVGQQGQRLGSANFVDHCGGQQHSSSPQEFHDLRIKALGVPPVQPQLSSADFGFIQHDFPHASDCGHRITAASKPSEVGSDRAVKCRAGTSLATARAHDRTGAPHLLRRPAV
jgi:hypothetical protein